MRSTSTSLIPNSRKPAPAKSASSAAVRLSISANAIAGLSGYWAQKRKAGLGRFISASLANHFNRAAKRIHNGGKTTRLDQTAVHFREILVAYLPANGEALDGSLTCAKFDPPNRPPGGERARGDCAYYSGHGCEWR